MLNTAGEGEDGEWQGEGGADSDLNFTKVRNSSAASNGPASSFHWKN